MMRRHLAVLPAFLLLAACQPQERPNTAAPTISAPAGIGLPPPDGARRYDAAIRPGDETRTARSSPVEPPRAVPAPRPSEAERRAVAVWEKEEAAARGPVSLSVAPPSRTRATGLALPPGVSAAALPRPAGDARPAGASRPASDLATPPSAGERPERPTAAVVETPKAAEAPPPIPSPPPAPAHEAEASTAPMPSPPPPSPPPAPAESPQTAAAAPVEPPRAAPSGPPLTTVTFSARSADLSDDARLALAWFARDPATQRLRRIELWAWAGDGDPIEARKVALARALAVHAYLIDLGVRASVEIAGFSDSRDATPNRVDVRTK